MFTLFAAAFVLGLVFNAAPGAVFAETVRQGVRGGFRPALAVQVGSLVGDGVWAVLGLVGVGVLLQVEALRWPIGLAGVAYLAWLSWDAWRSASQEFHLDAGGTPGAGTSRALRSGVTLSLTNPHNIAFWAALGSALGAVGVQQPTPADYGIFLAGFMASSVLWCFVCAAIVDRLFRRAGPGWARITYRLCALAFLALALASLRDLVAAPGQTPSAPPPALERRL
jgi:chemosensory pili system protein ChpE